MTNLVTLSLLFLVTGTAVFCLMKLTDKLIAPFKKYLSKEKNNSSIGDALNGIDIPLTGEHHHAAMLNGCHTELPVVCAETSEAATSLVEGAGEILSSVSAIGHHAVSHLVEII
jgi:hypothetical protein